MRGRICDVIQGVQALCGDLQRSRRRMEKVFKISWRNFWTAPKKIHWRSDKKKYIFEFPAWIVGNVEGFSVSYRCHHLYLWWVDTKCLWHLCGCLWVEWTRNSRLLEWNIIRILRIFLPKSEYILKLNTKPFNFYHFHRFLLSAFVFDVNSTFDRCHKCHRQRRLSFCRYFRRLIILSSFCYKPGISF